VIAEYYPNCKNDARVPYVDICLQSRPGGTPEAIVLPQDLTRKLPEDVCRRLSMATTEQLALIPTLEH
jgi:hypothetical protein